MPRAALRHADAEKAIHAFAHQTSKYSVDWKERYSHCNFRCAHRQPPYVEILAKLRQHRHASFGPNPLPRRQAAPLWPMLSPRARSREATEQPAGETSRQPRPGLSETETATVTGSAKTPSRGSRSTWERYPRLASVFPRPAFISLDCCLPIRPNGGGLAPISASGGLRGCPQGVGCISCEVYPPPSTGSYASMRRSRSPTTTPPSSSHTRLNTSQPINIALSHSRKGHLSTSKPWTN